MGLIHELLPLVAEEIGAISKNRQNEQQRYKFRGIDDCYNAVHGPLVKHGISVSTQVSDLHREERETKTGGTLIYTTLLLTTTFWAKDGSSVVTVTAGEAMDSGDKSTNKAMSAALKYAFLQTFTIPLEEPETEDDSPAPAPRRGKAADKPAPPAAPASKAGPADPEDWKGLVELLRLIGVPEGDKIRGAAVVRLANPDFDLGVCYSRHGACRQVLDKLTECQANGMSLDTIYHDALEQAKLLTPLERQGKQMF